MIQDLLQRKSSLGPKVSQKQDGIHKVPEGQKSPIKLPDLLLPDQSMQTTQPPFSEHCFVKTALGMLIEAFYNCFQMGKKSPV